MTDHQGGQANWPHGHPSFDQTHSRPKLYKRLKIKLTKYGWHRTRCLKPHIVKCDMSKENKILLLLLLLLYIEN